MPGSMHASVHILCELLVAELGAVMARPDDEGGDIAKERSEKSKHKDRGSGKDKHRDKSRAKDRRDAADDVQQAKGRPTEDANGGSSAAPPTELKGADDKESRKSSRRKSDADGDRHRDKDRDREWPRDRDRDRERDRERHSKRDRSEGRDDKEHGRKERAEAKARRDEEPQQEAEAHAAPSAPAGDAMEEDLPGPPAAAAASASQASTAAAAATAQVQDSGGEISMSIEETNRCAWVIPGWQHGSACACCGEHSKRHMWATGCASPWA